MFTLSTILYLWIAQAATISALLMVIWLHDRGQNHYIYWSAGFLLHALGTALLLGRGVIADIASVDVANASLLSAFFFWICGLRQCDRREPWGYAAIPALIWIAAMLVPDIRASFGMRVAVYALATTIGFIMLSANALTGRFSTPLVRRALGFIWAVQACNCAVFGVLNFRSNPQAFEELAYGTGFGMGGMASFIAALVVGAKAIQDQSEQRLRRLIGRDPLTDVLNRRGLWESLSSFTSGLASDSDVAVLVFDLDHFKTVNDGYGHQGGDAVLLQFASLCSASVGRKGLFSRTGGEEFTAVVAVANLQEAAQIGEALRRRVTEMSVSTERGEIRITVSIGIACGPLTSFDLESLMKQADKALYAAKAGGRNRAAVHGIDNILLVPTSSPAEHAERIDHSVDRQVAVLRKLSAVAAANMNRSAR